MSEWQEVPPPEGGELEDVPHQKPVLVWAPGLEYALVGEYDGAWYESYNGEALTVMPSHWMPLPEPPPP